MITINSLRPSQIRVVTFDCYGTLVDWETGIRRAFRVAAATDGLELDLDQVVEAYHAVEPMVEEGPFRPYRDVLVETARRVAAECGWSIDRDEASFLPRSLPGWPVFGDVNEALERIADSGRRIGILSNVDEDLLERTMQAFSVDFDFWVTADRVESYKPDLAHFEAARPYVGNQGHWLHVAQSLFHDVGPARVLGVPVVWINRKGEEPLSDSPGPDREMPDLTALADWLEA